MPYPQPSPLSGRVHRHYWSDRAHERTEFLTELVDRLVGAGVPTTVHEGWTDADLDIYPHGWVALHLCTVQEDHSGGRRLLRLRISMRPNHQMVWAGAAAAVLALLATLTPAWVAAVGALGLVLLAALAWRVGVQRRELLVAHADQAAGAIGLFAMQPPAAAPAPVPAEDTATVGAPAERSPVERVEEAIEGVMIVQGRRSQRLEPAAP